MLAASCNTTAGWLGVAAGAPALIDASKDLGFLARGDGNSSRAGAVFGPVDPSAEGSQATPAALYYQTATLGAEIQETQTEPGLLARAAIGQLGVRAALVDQAGLASSIADEEVPVTTLIQGSCRNGRFNEVELEVGGDRSISPDELSAIREGMGRVPGLIYVNGVKGALAQTGVRAAKTGTADYVYGSSYYRWVIGWTDQYVFAARVGPVFEGADENPSVRLANEVLQRVNALAASPPKDPCSTQ
jgi:cell division protein FtsI/penicillin-binding protein 2